MTNANELVHSFNHTAGAKGNFNGLTKREYFAAMALQGILADDSKLSINSKFVSGLAVEYADALIKALNETP